MEKKSENKSENKGLAVVTGASSGIGYELAKIFAQEGYDLLVAAEDAGIFEAADVFRKFGRSVEQLQVDLATFDGVEELVSKIKSIGQPLDSIAINAGVGVSGHFENTDLHEELNLIRLNIESVVHLTKRVLPDLIQRGEGRILMTSSVAAEMPGPYYAVYAASKAFIQSFAEAIRVEVKDSGVTVTALQPGATDTNFFERADMMDTKAGQAKKDDPAQVARQGFDAMIKGKDHVVAGSLMNKIQVAVGKFISQPEGACLQGSHTKPLSDQR